MKKLSTLPALILLLSTCLNAQTVTRIMVVADQHVISPVQDFRQTILYELTLAAIEEQVDFIFLPGDLIISMPGDTGMMDTVLADWRFVLDTLSHHDIRLLACRGNNDAGCGIAWDSLFSGSYSFPSNGPDTELNRTYAFEYNNVLFVSLDQYFNPHRINQEWLDSILAANTKPHVFVAGHEAAFKLYHTYIMGAYPEERNTFWESLVEAGTKIYFCGHDHFYDHSIIYDSAGTAGHEIHQVIAGTGGGYFHSDSEYNGDNGRWVPQRLFHEASFGYVLLDVNDMEVTLMWKHRTDSSTYEYGGDSYTFTASSSGYPVRDGSELLAFPNPFTTSTTLHFSNPGGDPYCLYIRDLSGKICRIVDEIRASGYILEKNDLDSGIYFIELKGPRVFRGMIIVL